MNGAKKYIITGGPGAGKTSLLQALMGLGYNGSAEVSRQLITEQVAKNSACLPWKNMACFAEKVLLRMVESYKQSNCYAGATFFDRGIPDIFAYLKVAGLPVHKGYYEALKLHPYHQTVYILPPWKEIFVNDPERWQTFEEATTLYNAIRKTYESLGFMLIEIPKGTVEERAHFLLSQQIQEKPCATTYS